MQQAISIYLERAADRSLIPLLALFLLLLPVAPAAADDAAELVTDRPDQTESSLVVPRGSYQLELGWTFFRDDQDGVHVEVHEAPGTLLRVGLSEKVELRIGWAGFIDAEAGRAGGATGNAAGRFEVGDDGIGDAELGAKIHLAEERGGRPEIALLLSTSVPVGDDAFTTDRFDPALRLALAHTLSERVSLGYNLGLAFESSRGDDGEEDTLSYAFYTVALGWALSDRWGAFVELYGDVPASASGGPANAFDGGFTYLVRDNLQLDFAGGAGLSEAADDWFVGLGLSVRFPE